MDPRILHVEDNADDVKLTSIAFRRAGALVQIEVASDGDKAISLLTPKNGTALNLPACVLLDIKLPTKSGLEVLSWIRSQQYLRALPVVIFTSSMLPDDINQAYDLGANSYLVKPPDLDSLVNLAKTIDQYWVRTNVRPSPKETRP